MKVTQIPGIILLFLGRVYNQLLGFCLRPLMRKCGRSVCLSYATSDFNYFTLEIGNDVYIGRGACFSARYSIIKLGGHVMISPNVTMRVGTIIHPAKGVS